MTHKKLKQIFNKGTLMTHKKLKQILDIMEKNAVTVLGTKMIRPQDAITAILKVSPYEKSKNENRHSK